MPWAAGTLPDMPTVTEAKLPAMLSRTWSGLVVRSDTPKEIVELLGREFAKAMVLPGVREQLAKLQAEVPTETLQQYRELIRRDIEEGVKFVRDNGIKAD